MSKDIYTETWFRFYDKNAPYFEFSNFYGPKKPIIIDGEPYKTTEHYFQAQKYAKDIGKNREFMALIKSQNTAGKAKILANPIKQTRWGWEQKLKKQREKYEKDIHFDPVEWNGIRDDVMKKALIAKFTQDDHCREVLLSTRDAILYEDTRRDAYWGNGSDPTKVGRLGELLMEVREIEKRKITKQ